MKLPGSYFSTASLPEGDSAEAPADNVLPSVEEATRTALRAAPKPVRTLVRNTLAAVSWIGLPATVLSTLSGLRWVIDAAAWCFQHAGLLQPVFAAVGQGIAWIVMLWRGLTHPLWEALGAWLGFGLPAWLPDVLTLLALLLIGGLRRLWRVIWGHRLSGALMYRGAKPGRAPPEQYIAIPRRFPYKALFAEYGFALNKRQLADTQRLWRKWRREQILVMLTADNYRWPTFREPVIEAQFGRFWLSVMEGRRDMRVYALVALATLGAFAIDAAYRLLLPHA